MLVDGREIGEVRAVLVGDDVCALPFGVHGEVDPPAEAVVFLILPDLLSGHNGGDSNACLLKHFICVARIVEGHEPVCDDLLDLEMVLRSHGQGRKIGIGLEIGAVHAVAQGIPCARTDSADDDGHGLAGVNAVGGHIGVVVAGAVLDVTLFVVILESIVDVNEIAHEREVNKLSLAGTLLVEQREHQSCKEALCADHVADDRADAGRIAVALAGLCVQAAHCNCADIVGGLAAVLVGLVTEGSERTVDDAGVHLLYVLIAEAELFKEAGLVGGNEHVEVLDDIEKELLCIGIAELDLDRLLAAVLAAGVGGYAVYIECEFSAAFAAGHLDLDDFRAIVCKIGAGLGA